GGHFEMTLSELFYRSAESCFSPALVPTCLFLASMTSATAQLRTDIVAFGGAGWGSIPVASSNGNGTFAVTNASVVTFPTWAATPGVQVVTGDFNGDGRTDLAAFGGAGWGSIPVAFSNGNGTFNVTNASDVKRPT